MRGGGREGGESKRAQVSTKRLNVDSLSGEKNRQKIFVLYFYLVFYSQNLKRKVIFLKHNDIVMWNGAGVPHPLSFPEIYLSGTTLHSINLMNWQISSYLFVCVTRDYINT